MAKKKSKTKKKKSSRKSNQNKPKNENRKPNYYFLTTIFAIIGTFVYWLIVKYAFSVSVTWIQILVFFAVFWVVYFFIEKKMYKKHRKKY